MTNKERKEKGMVYCYDDPTLLSNQHIYQNKMIEYNQTMPNETEKRQQLLPEVFAKVGKGCTVEPPPLKCKLGMQACSFRKWNLHQFEYYICRR